MVEPLSAYDSRIMRHEGSNFLHLSAEFRPFPAVFDGLPTISPHVPRFSSFSVVFVGPYSLNGVPLRRVNQKYVIATSTSVPLSGVDVSSVDDALFAREADAAARASTQASIDAALVANINKTEMLGAYLQARFTLGKYDRPHLLKF